MNTIYRIWRKSDEMWMYDVSTIEAAENHSEAYYYTILPNYRSYR
jgi:hypothetical protein